MYLLKRIRPLWVLWILLALTAVGWAVAELSGQANKSAADAGASSADMEMASMDTIKPSKKSPTCDWKLEKSLRAQLTKLDKEYKPLVTKAQSEADATGKVSDATGSKLTQSAAAFKKASDQYADMWDKCKCTSRANLARESGATRVASAELIVAGADSDKADALKAQQEKMNDARHTYAQEAKDNNELSAADKAAIKASVAPRAQKLMGDTGKLVTQIGNLLNQVKSQANPASLVSGAGGCASKAASGSSASPADSATSLLSPVTSLFSLAQGLASNAKSLSDDTAMLTQ